MLADVLPRSIVVLGQQVDKSNPYGVDKTSSSSLPHTCGPLGAPSERAVDAGAASFADAQADSIRRAEARARRESRFEAAMDDARQNVGALPRRPAARWRNARVGG